MLRYKTKTRPGLVALYDIRPGNGAGPFLQPRSPHGAIKRRKEEEKKREKTGRPDVRDRQHHRSMPPLRGRGHNKWRSWL